MRARATSASNTRNDNTQHQGFSGPTVRVFTRRFKEYVFDTRAREHYSSISISGIQCLLLDSCRNFHGNLRPGITPILQREKTDTQLSLVHHRVLKHSILWWTKFAKPERSHAWYIVAEQGNKGLWDFHLGFLHHRNDVTLHFLSQKDPIFHVPTECHWPSAGNCHVGDLCPRTRLDLTSDDIWTCAVLFGDEIVVCVASFSSFPLDETLLRLTNNDHVDPREP